MKAEKKTMLTEEKIMQITKGKKRKRNLKRRQCKEGKIMQIDTKGKKQGN